MILRSLFFIFIYVPFMLVALPSQFVITRLKLPFWHFFPRLFHRLGCVFVGVRVTVIGVPETERPTLLVANHISWTDIISIAVPQAWLCEPVPQAWLCDPVPRNCVTL